MSLRSVVFASFSLAACQAVPSADPSPTAALVDELVRARAGSDAQSALLVSLLAQRAGNPLRDEGEAAGTTELVARLATLNERLDELLTRLPASPGGTVATEAAARRDGPPSPGDAAAIAMVQQALRVTDRLRDLILENLANVHTAGYKKRHLQVSTTLQPGTGLQMPVAAAEVMIATMGTLEITDRNLDVAIDGDGWFAVLAEDGSTRYTRNGGFHVNAGGRIVTGDGLVVLPGITVPADTLEISIDPEGRVSGLTAGNPDTATAFGQLTLSRFVNPGGLAPAGACAVRPADAAGRPISGQPGTNGLGVLKQGFVERSNVQVLDELVNLQLTERQRTMLRRVLASYGIFVR